ncbi:MULTISPECIES: universal stress protein [Ferrimonas]|uniref:universal stress protein n=1 Tax=Ferrimonas TaxID=44011 RepID=UPI00041CF1FD|nr:MULTISPECIES: universal stress protein [Ferrimonas]USD38393.1 universal stress protein [Ferrimonas sp. SCSIO 43195]
MQKLLIVAPEKEQQFDAINKGLELAQALSAKAEVVGYCYEPLSVMEGTPEEVVNGIKSELMASRSAALRHRVTALGQSVPTTVRWAKGIADDICELVNNGFTMVVKAYRQSDHLLPTDWHLIRRTRVPLMLLTDHQPAQGQDVLAALDLGSGSEAKQRLNQQVLHAARELVKATGGKLHVAYVIRLSRVVRDLEIIDTRHLLKEVYRKHGLLLESLALPKEQIHVQVGDASECLPQLAATLGVGYFAIGARQRRGLLGFVIGNTAEAILHRMRSHLLVVPGTEG